MRYFLQWLTTNMFFIFRDILLVSWMNGWITNMFPNHCILVSDLDEWKSPWKDRSNKEITKAFFLSALPFIFLSPQKVSTLHRIPCKSVETQAGQTHVKLDKPRFNMGLNLYTFAICMVDYLAADQMNQMKLTYP